MTKKKEIWNRVKKSLRTSLSDADFMTWFPQANLVKIDPEQAVIEVPNKFIATWLRDKYSAKIQSSFRESVNLIPAIHFTYPTSQKSNKSRYVSSQNGLSMSNMLIEFLTFSHFIVSNCNRFAYYSASEVADNPGVHYNPLYLFGNPGVGKTHLLHAVGNKIVHYNPLARIKYLSADKFCSDFDNSREYGKIDRFRAKFNILDCLLLDDVQILGEHIKPQEELVMLLDAYHKSKTQIVMASTLSPSQIRNIKPTLKSRMEGGLLAEIELPDEHTKREFTTRKLKEEGLSIPEDVLFFISNSTNDLNMLDQHISNIFDHSSLLKKGEVDLSLVKSIVKKEQKDSVDIHEIQRTTARYFNISLSNLISNEKRRDFSYPRQIAMYLSRKLIDLSYKDIGKDFGNKDHSTIIYAIKRIEEQKIKNKKVLNHLEDLTSLLT
jgi:chromosomal replication initiator protein